MTWLFAFAFGVLQSSVAGPGFTPFCQIVADPQRYDQKTVLTSGVYAAFPEFANFVDPDCPTTPERDVATFPTPARPRVQDTAGWKRLRQRVEKDEKAFVVVRAVFDACSRYEGPIPDDPKLREIVLLGNSRFGHMNFARFRLRIESVEFVAPVTD